MWLRSFLDPWGVAGGRLHGPGHPIGQTVVGVATLPPTVQLQMRDGGTFG